MSGGVAISISPHKIVIKLKCDYPFLCPASDGVHRRDYKGFKRTANINYQNSGNLFGEIFSAPLCSKKIRDTLEELCLNK